MLERAPAPEVSDWKGTVEPTVDATKHVNGGCRSLRSDGREWECYLGQRGRGPADHRAEVPGRVRPVGPDGLAAGRRAVRAGRRRLTSSSRSRCSSCATRSSSSSNSSFVTSPRSARTSANSALGAIADPAGLGAPAPHRVLDHGTHLVAAHSTAPREVVGQAVGPLGGQRDGSDGSQPELPNELPDGAAIVHRRLPGAAVRAGPAPLAAPLAA